MRKLALFVLVLCFPAYAQEPGIVTIYGAGEWSKSAKAKATLGTFKGDVPSMAYLFDGKERLGFLFPGYYISIRLQPGKHVLSASRDFGHPDPKQSAELMIEQGGRYFYRMKVTGTGAVWNRAVGHLQVVTCKEAQGEAAAAKPISLKEVDKDKQSAVVDRDSFPKCE